MRGLYLISDVGAAELRAAHAQPISAEAIEAFASRRGAGNGTPDILRVVDGTAEITVQGVLTAQPDFFAAFFAGGNTTYPDISTSLRLAAADPAVRDVVLSVSSPGGEVDGLFELLQEIEAFSKPIRSRASAAQSAAYGIVAATESIEATTEASMFGSVGVAMQLFHDDSVIDLTNTDSPDKRPDATTPEGKAVLQRQLDSIFDLFAGAIARGRSTTLETVRTSFGRGATLLASQARAAGMIDSVRPRPAKPAPAARAAVPADSLAGLLATRLDGETAEAYVARCERLLAAVARPAPTPAPAPTRADLSAAVAAIQSGMPLAYPSGEPAGAADVLAQLEAMPEPYASPQAPGEAPTPTALAAAVQRLTDVEWPAPTPSTAAQPAPIAAPPGAELAAALEAEIEQQVAS